MQRLRALPVPLKIVAYAAAAAALLAVAAGVGAIAALTLGPEEGFPEGAKPEQAGKAKPGQENAAEVGASDGSPKAAYLSKVADIQNKSVEAALKSNDMLFRYDSLTADDVEDMQANYATLRASSDKVKGLDPPGKYGDQYEVFVVAIDELRDANELAYRLAADPTSATQADFEAYDRHIDSATTHLQRSNEMLGQDYKTTQTAQETSLG